MKGIIRILMRIVLFKYYQVKCKILKAPVWEMPESKLIENDFRLIENKTNRNGIVVKDIYLNKNEFEEFKRKFIFGEDFYGGIKSTLYNEKTLEHFIVYKYCIEILKQDDIYIDVAACESPWAKLLREKGYNAYEIDLQCSLKYE